MYVYVLFNKHAHIRTLLHAHAHDIYTRVHFLGRASLCIPITIIMGVYRPYYSRDSCYRVDVVRYDVTAFATTLDITTLSGALP